ncbi:MAG: hypothetical protein NXI22_17955, partial [bacterium]|nr:hypothetical protein [bacterium]
MTPEEYTEFLKKTHERLQIDYLYDGQPVTDIQQKFPDFDPPPENVYFEIKFKDLPAPEIIEVGSLEDLSAERLDGMNQDPYDRSYFNAKGQALLASLKQVGGDTQLNNGDQIIFDRETAQKYIDVGHADLVNRYYFRPLRDYEYYFDDLREQGNDLDESKSAVAARTAKVKEAQAKLYGDDVDNPTAQIGARTAEKTKLEEDKAHFLAEVEQLKAERQKLESQTEKLTNFLNEVVKVTETQEDELETIQMRLKSEIDARTAAPLSSGL